MAESLCYLIPVRSSACVFTVDFLGSNVVAILIFVTKPLRPHWGMSAKRMLWEEASNVSHL